MAKTISETQLTAIEKAVSTRTEGMGIQDILDLLGEELPRRTLQYQLKHLVDSGRLIRTGQKRAARYEIASGFAAADVNIPATYKENLAGEIPISRDAAEVLEYVGRPFISRKPVGYDRDFLDRYQPNHTNWFSKSERSLLRTLGTSSSWQQPAGTHAKTIIHRLLIDLSWNSSRLEGNTYSLLDTKRLIDFGVEAEGKNQVEAQMILNHKDAIEFLVGSASEIGVNRHTILNLHGLLANNLLADPNATGRLRQMAVGIERSVFHPLEVPQLIAETFDQILAKAEAIEDPFEQALFAMVQLPYLQPFDDVNKRVSRLAANIPLIKANLTPLSFIDVPTGLYTDAMLGVYELKKVDLLKDIFLWAYERSAARYAAVRQSLGEPDPFRLRYRDELREVVRTIVLERKNRKAAFQCISSWAEKNIEKKYQQQFREIVEDEVLSLHAGNFARYQVTLVQFSQWQEVLGMRRGL